MFKMGKNIWGLYCKIENEKRMKEGTMIPNNKLVTDKVLKYIREKVKGYRINDSWENFYQEAIGYILLNEVSLHELRATYKNFSMKLNLRMVSILLSI